MAEAATRLTGGLGRIGLAFERSGQDLRGHLVAALGQGHGDVAVGTPIDPGRPPRAGSTALVDPPVVSDEQPAIHQPIEVERCQRATDGKRSGGLLPANRSVLIDDPVVQAASRRLVEQGDRRDVGIGGFRSRRHRAASLSRTFTRERVDTQPGSVYL